jgi:CRISPR system Cascade subunit CasB
MSQQTQKTPAQVRRAVGRAVAIQASQLQRAYRNDEANAVRRLAVLRRGLGRSPLESPDTWDDVAAVLADEDALGHGMDTPTANEWAAHLALTLFALHQQSKRERDMHVTGKSLGTAARDLVELVSKKRESAEPPSTSDAGPKRSSDWRDSEAGKSTVKRFKTLASASTIEEIAYYSRSMISQLRSFDIPLDYGLLTEHLALLQRPELAPGVRARWARDFYRGPSESNTETSNDTPE